MSQPLQISLTQEVARDSDYDKIARIISLISENYRDQPSLEDLAASVSMEPTALQKLFTRWAGLSPKGFLQAVTIDHARRLLAADLPLLDTAYELGLSGPSRLHDLFVTHEAMSPGEIKSGGNGLTQVGTSKPGSFRGLRRVPARSCFLCKRFLP